MSSFFWICFSKFEVEKKDIYLKKNKENYEKH